MPRPNSASPGTPQDAYERERRANLHPDPWINPKPIGPYHLVVIGAGPGGVAAAEVASALGAKVALVERRLIGGDRLNFGCIPSKTLIRSANLYADMRDAQLYGAQVPSDITVDFAAVMERVRRIRSHLSKEDSVLRLTRKGVDVFFGDAQFSGPSTLVVGGDVLHFEKALIATGASPLIPPIPGLAEAGYLNAQNVFDLTELPRRMVVIGGGPLGCELAQAFCRLGSKITIVQDKPLFLGNEERDAAQLLSEAFARDGIEVRLNTTTVAIRMENGEKLVDLVSDDYRNTVAVDAVAAGAGRVPNIQHLALDVAGVDYDSADGVLIDDFLRTSNPNIYAAGDVCLQHKYTHTAEAAAHIVVQNALFGGRERMSELVIPWCTFTDPQIAHVGMYVREANKLDIPIKTFTIPMHEIDRAVTDSEENGFVKIHVKGKTDEILGATIVARHAGDMINEITLAMVAGIGLRTLARVMHAYPTQSSAIQKAAQAYYRTRFTSRVQARAQRWLAR